MAVSRLLIPVVVGLLLLGYFSVFTISETELGIKFRLGEIVRSDYAPGLHFKLPIVNNVRKYDKRILNLDAEPQRFLTSEKKDVIVDSYTKWRIVDVRKYYNATGGDYTQANTLLYQKVNDALRAAFGLRTVQEVVSGERGEVMDIVTVRANELAAELGVEVIDVRTKRIDLPSEVSDAVYARMRAERERVARDFRSRGREQAERIRAAADRERTVILAEAYRDAETIRGKGDAMATEIYAKTYRKDEEFYALYRSLSAYRESFRDRSDILVLQPGSDFFKYFNNPSGERSQ
jgi:membrane protease subunit HflC